MDSTMSGKKEAHRVLMEWFGKEANVVWKHEENDLILVMVISAGWLYVMRLFIINQNWVLSQDKVFEIAELGS